MKRLQILLFAIPLALALAVSAARAESDVKEGYDENTEITVRGKVVGADRPMRGPVVLTLMRRGRVFKVITAPPWYLAQEGISFAPGDRLEVSGSKYFGSDGSLSGRAGTYTSKGSYEIKDDGSICMNWENRYWKSYCTRRYPEPSGEVLAIDNGGQVQFRVKQNLPGNPEGL